ncbi:MAG: hypothetical protein ACRD2W_09870 [Acidimicrobiales bacterium]
MFGIRTILPGCDLLGTPDDHTLRRAVVVHGSDLATAVLLGVRRRVPPRTALLLTAISTANTGLALAARSEG